MATVVPPAMSESLASNCWRFSFSDRRSSLIDRGSFSLDRRPSAPECRVSYKSDDKLRRRNSWRWSWKNVFTRPFQSTSRAGSFREKDKIRKKISPRSAHSSPKDSVEARMQMAKLLRMWYTDVADSSDDSSDDEGDSSLRDRRRSCSPRIIGDESSSSVDEDERMEQEGTSNGTQVSLYVSEGPSSSMDADGRETVQRIPEPGNQDGTNSDATSNSGSRQRSPETEHEQPALPVNSEREVLTGVDDAINHGGVISAIQICNLERFVDFTKQVEHSCCSGCCEQCSGYKGVDVDKVRQKLKSNEALCEGAEARCGTCTRGSGSFGGSAVKAAGGHRLSLPSPQEMSVEGSIDAMSNLVRSEDLSVAIQNKCSETRREELIKGSLDEDRSEDMQRMEKEQGVEQVEISDEMADLFSSQDLNAIRRFLGMSLQQISANKVLEKVSVKPTAVVSLGDLMERRNQQMTHVDDHPLVMQTREVLPDYPSTYNKDGENEYTKEQIDEPCELHCEFKGFGCPFQGTRWVLELEKHMKCNIGEHLTFVSQTAQGQKEQLKDQRLLQEKQGRLIRELTGTVHNLKDIVQDEFQKNQSQEKLILSLKDQLREQRKQNQRFEREISRQFQALDQSTPTTGLPSSPSAAEMLWPIKNFSKRLRRVREGELDDPSISEPFYTGSSGYKLSIWVYLNGRGKNLGSCVSVYARVMPGDNDTILNWPVRPAYTFTLFDQSEGEKENIVRTRKVNDIKREGAKHRGIDRPGGGDRSVIVGFDDFIAHDQLERSNYLVDDCFFLKLEAKLFN